MKKVMVLAAVVFIAGCSGLAGLNLHFLTAKKRPTRKSTYVAEITTKHCELRPFSEIIARGDSKIEIVNGPYSMDVTGINLHKYPCRGGQIGKTLNVGHVTNKSMNVMVKVSAPRIKRIVVADKATVSGKNFKSEDMVIIANGNGGVNIEGALNVKKIFQYGRGRINANWVYGKNLYVEAHDSGPITLAGRVDNMTVKLVNDARFYGRYLRANKASVFTTNRALAEVLVLDNLGAFAIDHSNIYYYKKPDDITVVTRDAGNVLSPEQVI